MQVAAAYFLVLAIIASYDRVRAESALPPAAGQPVEFQQQIQPLFEKHCVKCHGPEKQKGDLRLDVKSMGEGVGNWDGHKTLKQQYGIHGPILDQPVAGLLRDLKQRGLFADTLVAFVTEFGRMPTFQKGASGRDHNPAGFTVWLAGAGVKSGFSHGATDEFGHKAVENVCTIYDLHATILHLLGLDHERLSYYHNGIERRLTDVHGHVIQPILS